VGATGATGATGPAGGVGSLAYGTVSAQAGVPVIANGDVTFDLVPNPATGASNAITPTATGFTIVNTGVYEYDFDVRGTPQHLVPPDTLAFCLTRNGVTINPGTEFAADVQTTSLAAGDTEHVHGHGLQAFTAGDVVTLRNRTLSGTASVSFTSAPPGGEAAIYASLTLKQVA
jgi:hypothetical protein